MVMLKIQHILAKLVQYVLYWSNNYIIRISFRFIWLWSWFNQSPKYKVQTTYTTYQKRGTYQFLLHFIQDSYQGKEFILREFTYQIPFEIEVFVLVNSSCFVSWATNHGSCFTTWHFQHYQTLTFSTKQINILDI